MQTVHLAKTNQLQAQMGQPLGMYLIWRMEKEIWLEGHKAMKKYVKDDALIIPPTPLSPARFETIFEALKRATPFDEIILEQRHFLQMRNITIINYLASAKHQRYRGRYYARCSTTYVRDEGLYKIAAHTHNRLTRSAIT
jgi:hypothetical protein